LRGWGAVGSPASEARKLLTEKQALRAMRVSNLAMEELHSIAEGKRRRGAGFQIAAIRLMAEHTLRKPAQEHELSGNVTIRVECAIPTRAAVVPPQHLVEEVAEKEAERVDSPIRGRYVNSLPAPQDVVESELVHEAGRLVGSPDKRSVEERRQAARQEWADEQAALREAKP